MWLINDVWKWPAVVIEQGHLEAQAGRQLMLAVSSDTMIQKTPLPPLPPTPTVPSSTVSQPPPPLPPTSTPPVPSSTAIPPPPLPTLHPSHPSPPVPQLCPVCLIYLCHCQSHSPCCHSNHFFHPPTYTHTHPCVCYSPLQSEDTFSQIYFVWIFPTYFSQLFVVVVVTSLRHYRLCSSTNRASPRTHWH